MPNLRSIAFALIVLCLGVAVACRSANSSSADSSDKSTLAPRTENLTADQFEQQLQQPNALLLDVRTPDEYAQGHLRGATLIDIEATDFDQKIATLDRSKTIMVYCTTGGRSSDAVERLQKAGFGKIQNLTQGYDDWTAKGKATEK